MIQLARNATAGLALLAVLMLVGRENVAQQPKTPPAETVFQPAGRGDVTQLLVERGTVEAVRQAEVVCRVKGQGAVNTIRWLVDDGTVVKNGDRLAELDDSAARDRVRAQEVAVVQAHAAAVEIAGRRKAVEAQVEGGLKSAAGELEVAKLAARHVVEAEAGRKRKHELQVELARARLELARVQAAGPQAPAVVKHAVRAAELELEGAEIELKLAAGEGVVRKRRAELGVDQAETALAVAKLEATGKRTQAEAVEAAARGALELEEVKLQAVKDELANCVLHSPADGIAVYNVPEGGRFGQQTVVGVGEQVRDGQRLLTVVDLSQMQIRVRVPESWVSRLRPGMAATVRVDAVPNQPRAGKLKSIATIASQPDWLAADVKVYPAVVALDAHPDALKPGMTTDPYQAVKYNQPNRTGRG